METRRAHLYFVSGMYTHAQTDPINPSPPKMNPTLPPKFASSGLTRYLNHASALSGIELGHARDDNVGNHSAERVDKDADTDRLGA
jgi:hypothetical protein